MRAEPSILNGGASGPTARIGPLAAGRMTSGPRSHSPSNSTRVHGVYGPAVWGETLWALLPFGQAVTGCGAPCLITVL